MGARPWHMGANTEAHGGAREGPHRNRGHQHPPGTPAPQTKSSRRQTWPAARPAAGWRAATRPAETAAGASRRRAGGGGGSSSGESQGAGRCSERSKSHQSAGALLAIPDTAGRGPRSPACPASASSAHAPAGCPPSTCPRPCTAAPARAPGAGRGAVCGSCAGCSCGPRLPCKHNQFVRSAVRVSLVRPAGRRRCRCAVAALAAPRGPAVCSCPFCRKSTIYVCQTPHCLASQPAINYVCCCIGELCRQKSTRRGQERSKRKERGRKRCTGCHEWAGKARQHSRRASGIRGVGSWVVHAKPEQR